MNILAIDPAQKFGWAQSIDGEITSGVFDLKPFGQMAAQGWQFSKWVSDKIIDADLLIIERMFMGRNGDTTFRLSGLAFTAMSIAYGHEKQIHELAPKSLKMFTTGSGKATKDEMVAKVREWGFNPADDNEADAIALLTYAQEKLCQ